METLTEYKKDQNNERRRPGRSMPKSTISIVPIIIRNGITAGFLMGAYLILLQTAEWDQSIWLKFLKYLFLALVLGFTLRRAKNFFSPVQYFRRGIQLGAGISFLSGLLLMALNAVLFSIDPAISFNKFSLEASNVGQLIILDFVLLFEVFVYGMILTFIFLQFLKYQNPKGDRVI